jgi:hypothetical protein
MPLPRLIQACFVQKQPQPGYLSEKLRFPAAAGVSLCGHDDLAG